MSADDRSELEAIRWRLRVHDMRDAEWAQFTAWLEADPRHGTAYDAVARMEDATGSLLGRLPRASAAVEQAADIPAMAEPAPRRRPHVWMSIAASLVALVGATLGVHYWPATVEDRIVATRAGEQRSIRLADGTIVLINGASRLAIAGAGGRQVRLEQGEAAFKVIHDDRRPFEVVAGTTVLRDVGTFFNVARREDGVEVTVAEGAVAYDPDSSNVMLHAGQAARLGGTPAVLQIAEVDRAAVASWRMGKLVFRDAPLPLVAADLGRSVGWPITFDSALATRRFSGTIRVVHDRERMRERLAGLLDVTISDTAGGWRLSADAPPSSRW